MTARFAVGDKVTQTRGTFLYGGVFVTAGAVLVVEAVREEPEGVRYDLRYLDRESMPHTLAGFKEEELRPAP